MSHHEHSNHSSQHSQKNGLRIPDYHMHTPLCNHATGDPREYVQQAIKLGLLEIGFSDHNPMPAGYDTLRMRHDQVDDYVSMIREVQREFHHFPILLGMECDYVPGTVEYVRDMLHQHDFDYVIGSVHYLDKWGFDAPEALEEWKRQKDVYSIWKKYFVLWADACNTRLFDIMAHPDLVKKFGHIPQQSCEELFNEALRAASKAKIILEVNTAGLRKPVREIYPSLAFLKIACHLKIPIVFGSDAHSPQEVGMNFKDGIQLAREAGYTEAVRLQNGKRIAYRI